MGIVCNKCGNSNISEYCAKCNPFEYIVKPPETKFSSILADTYCGDPTCILCKNNGSMQANKRYDYFPVEGEDIEDYLDAYSSYPKSKDSNYTDINTKHNNKDNNKDLGAGVKIVYDSRAVPAKPAFSATAKKLSIRFFRTVERRLENYERKIKYFKRNYPKFFTLLLKIFCVLCTIVASAGLYYISGNLASFLFGIIIGSYFNQIVNQGL